MARRGARRAGSAADAAADPQSLAAWQARYLEWMRTQNYSERTIEQREGYLGLFARWCEERGLTRPTEITKPILERYQRHVYYLRRRDGRPLAFRSQFTRLVPVRALFKWLTRQNALLYNPASELELPRLERRLPRAVLTASEADAVLAQPDVTQTLGLRDRAMLETLYSTGMRRMELGRLEVFDLDLERGTLWVRQGKGRKDRMVPVGERAAAWIEKYRSESRPALLADPAEVMLFLTAEGTAFTPNRLTQLVAGYVERAAIGKRGACHLFRHTMATLMLEGGADIRFIQQMLGHAVLSTTQIYTQVSIRALQQIHAATHPGARLGRTAAALGELSAADDSTPAALLAMLEAEASEEEAEDGAR